MMVESTHGQSKEVLKATANLGEGMEVLSSESTSRNEAQIQRSFSKDLYY